MKFIHYLEKITGVDIYAMAAFIIFFSIFIIMAIWAWKADKKMINYLRNIPLED
ncbi:CcoQ/FixQ family Cbb3-type cytochrome c oxidase assembly chaperone [Danxiaibacter flavus]|uniref:CcoQ/FixQ family Cbb3-type cytochrome c oxidase assembly chaperone n=1 Tax=Danxiaibacter flavus TaxID=3049108 RepID=A0ABV3Z829_9BACT|nr:CcoQ/FixQ family Cbb3-type cytochrome c oxidase assembly chaperone [Chitinophagaceae bacterium DXS]